MKAFLLIFLLIGCTTEPHKIPDNCVYRQHAIADGMYGEIYRCGSIEIFVSDKVYRINECKSTH